MNKKTIINNLDEIIEKIKDLKTYNIDILTYIRNEITLIRNQTKDPNTQQQLNDIITTISNILYN